MEFSTKHIDYLSRNFLDGIGEKKVELSGPDVFVPKQSSLALLHLSGVSRFWEFRPNQKEILELTRYRMEDVISGCHATGMPLVFLVRGFASSPDIEIYIGTLEPCLNTSRKYAVGAAIAFVDRSLPGHYPGIQTVRLSDEKIISVLEGIGAAKYFGMITGIPAMKVTDEPDDPTQMDRLVRTMHGTDWGYLVIAQPVPNSQIIAMVHSVLNETRLVGSAEETKMARAPLALSYMDMLEKMRMELYEGSATGLWAASGYYFSTDEGYFLKLGGAIRAYFGGEKSAPDPVRAFELPSASAVVPKFGQIIMKPERGPGEFQYPFRFQTMLNSRRLSFLMHLPRLEAPGFAIRQSCYFDVMSHQQEKEGLIEIGEVLHYGGPIGNQCRVSVDSLQKHALVVGVTGSGKTNTSFHLLDQLWRLGIPFLVLEPAKTEYRALLIHDKIGPDLRIFTLGDERVSPLRMNPFEVESGVSVSTHIDLLKSVFNASFGMWNPLPQVLERCIHEVYRDRGWDPSRNINVRLESEGAGDGEAYPTLTDLYEKIEEVAERLGYEERVKSDIKAALMTRVNSLQIGSKGIMLDTHRSVPISELLSKPTVIELEQIGDDDEKAFLMGLLLTRIYEYLRGHSSTEGTGLKHVVVIEEAHRLLANVPPQVDREQSNARGKAVETFANVLSEVRAYGEGFIVAEQIAMKLSLDVIKNTNLKIVHRTVAGEDRKMLADSMNMDSRQCDMLSVLRRGEATVFVEGDDKPIMVAVPYAKVRIPAKMETKAGSDQRVAEHMRTFRSQTHISPLFVPFADCYRICDGSMRYCDDAKETAARKDFQERFSALVLSLAVKGRVDDAEYQALLRFARSRLPQHRLNVGVFACSVLNALRWYFDYFGRRYSWSYETVGQLRSLLSSALLDSLPETNRSPDVTARAADKMRQFQDSYRKACLRIVDPFPTCREICRSGWCLFRYHNEMLLQDDRLTSLFDQGMNAALDRLTAAEDEPDTAQDKRTWPDIRALAQAVVRLNGYGMPADIQRSIGLCYGVLQVSYRAGMLDSAKELAIGRLLADPSLKP